MTKQKKCPKCNQAMEKQGGEWICFDCGKSMIKLKYYHKPGRVGGTPIEDESGSWSDGIRILEDG